MPTRVVPIVLVTLVLPCLAPVALASDHVVNGKPRMTAYLDASALVKRYIVERGSRETIARFDTLEPTDLRRLR